MQEPSTITKWAGAWVFTLAVISVTAFAPAQVAAQCSGCAADPGNPGQEVCGDPAGKEKCQGATSGVCDPCDNLIAAGLTADGTLYGPQVASMDELRMDGFAADDELSPGVVVTRHVCSGVITARTYARDAAERARHATAVLAFR